MNNNQAAAPKRRKRFSFKNLEKAPLITEAMAILLISVLLFTGENDKIAPELFLSIFLLASSLLLFVQYIWNKQRIATAGFAVCFTAYSALYSWLFIEELGALSAFYVLSCFTLVILTVLHAIPFFAKRPYWLWFVNCIPTAMLVITGLMSFRGLIGGTSVFGFKVFIEAVVVFLISRSLQYPVRIPENKMSHKIEIERNGKIFSIIGIVIAVVLVFAVNIVLKHSQESIAEMVSGIDLSALPPFPFR